jgi:hypothetical protein
MSGFLGSGLRACLAALAAIGLAVSAYAEDRCAKFHIDPMASTAIWPVSVPATGCVATIRNGYPIPDPRCTPGAFNPTMTAEILRDKTYRTSCNRDMATSASKKATTYALYGIPHPDNNTGKNMTCELDHLISLELGGADTLENIWPQCGPAGVALRDRYFKQKDIVENYLGREVKSGQMSLEEARRGISTDWTYYLPYALAARGK